MSRTSAISVFALILFATSTCQADSLVITYRSGKTQTVILDEPSQTVNSWQYVSGTSSQQLQKGDTPPTGADEKLTEKAPEKKPSVRVKWNAKPISD